jgi:hypothetical protein
LAPGRAFGELRDERSRIIGLSKFPPLQHPVKRGLALERPGIGREEAETDRAAAVTVIDPADHTDGALFGGELYPACSRDCLIVRNDVVRSAY